MQSLLAPAAQGRLKVWGSLANEANNLPVDTAVCDDGHQSEHRVMESLCLRRDLSSTATPPFGVWWAYTIEETLLWPILMFGGSINYSLDIVILGSHDNDDSEDEDGSFTQVKPMDGRGLDDGIIVPGLIVSFLENVHAKCPFLEPQTLRREAADVVENGLSWNASTCTVLLACALGAISSTWNRDTLFDYSRRNPPSDRLSMAREYFLAGQKRLGPLYASGSLKAAHCLFLAGTYYMYTLQPVAGWRLWNATSISCRTYISKKTARENMGLRLDTCSLRDLETRLYWSCFMAEREVACEFGMETHGLNLIANLNSLPTPPPNHPPPDTPGDQLPFSSHAIQDERSWYFFLTHIMLRKLEMRIDNFTQAKQQEAYRCAGAAPEAFYQGLYEANAEFDFELTCYYESLPPTVQFPLYESTSCPDELRQYLKWRVTSVRHDICMPAFYALLHYDVTGWAEELVDGLIVHANTLLRLEIGLLWAAASTHRDINTWLALRKGVRAGLILVAARRLTDQNRPGLEALQVPENETCWHAAQALVQGLKYWATESRDCVNNLEMLQNLHSDFRE